MKKLKKTNEITTIDEEGELINPPEDIQSDYLYFVEQPFYNINFFTHQAKLVKTQKTSTISKC